MSDRMHLAGQSSLFEFNWHSFQTPVIDLEAELQTGVSGVPSATKTAATPKDSAAPTTALAERYQKLLQEEIKWAEQHQEKRLPQLMEEAEVVKNVAIHQDWLDAKNSARTAAAKKVCIVLSVRMHSDSVIFLGHQLLFQHLDSELGQQEYISSKWQQWISSAEYKAVQELVCSKCGLFLVDSCWLLS